MLTTGQLSHFITGGLGTFTLARSTLTRSCSWLLLRALAQQQAKAEEETAASLQSLTADTSDDDKPDDSDTTQHDTIGHVDVHTPKVSYYDARQIMTRTDFLEGLDHFNVSTFT
jgi:hypothetical protein